MNGRKILGLIAVVGLFAVSGIIGMERLHADDTVSGVRSEDSESMLVSGDINADQKVNLKDVIFVLRLITGIDAGTVSPGGDVDADGRISIKEALYMLRTTTAFYAYLQPFIDEYLAAVPPEQALDDVSTQRLERTFYLNGDTGPALKMPTIEFSAQGVDFSVNVGSYTPPSSPPETIDTVQVLFYDAAYGEWGYGINRDTLTSFLAETSHDNDFSSTYSLFIDGLKMISDGAVKDLNDTDPAKGFLLHVTTDAGSEFLVGAGNTVNLLAVAGVRGAAIDDAILDRADEVEALPLITGGCACPVVDMLAELQKSFAKQGVALTEDHLEIKESQPAFSCGDSFKATIRLGSDLEVLESYQKLGQRIKDGDFRAVEPAGYFRGAHYLLQLSFWSWWDPGGGACICQFSWELVQVRTARIIGAGFVTKPCGDMETAFDAMLGEIEGGPDWQFFILSDDDYQIPNCDDDNPCTWDAYDLNIHECVHRVKSASLNTLCDDGDLCTINDKCVLANCVGTPIICNDSNPCTQDACDPATSDCKYDAETLDGTSCDDGDPATDNDECAEGTCQGTENPDYLLPGVPVATGQPSFSPSEITAFSNDTTIVSIPVSADTQSAAIRLFKTDGNIVVMTGGPTGTNPVEIQTPSIYTPEGALYLQFFVSNSTGAHSDYTRDTNLSDAFYTLFQDDNKGHTLTKVSNIPIAWLTVLPY